MSKKLESEAFTCLQAYIQERLPGSALQPTMNKGRGNSSPHLADAVLEHEGRTYHIEIKASSGKVGHNIRFAHQTVAKAVGKDVIVALISNVGTGAPAFEFFRLSDVAQSLCIEPHFLVAAKHTKDKSQPLGSLLKLPDAALDVSTLLDSSVRDHTNLRRPPSVESAKGEDREPRQPDESDSTPPGQPLWSPYVSATDKDGDPYPPWLKYPNLPRTSMGWRMGEGESYVEEFHGWLARQPTDMIQVYQAKYPAPHEWEAIWPSE